MNKRYFDFVPAKKQSAAARPSAQMVQRKTIPPRATVIAHTTVTKTTVTGVATRPLGTPSSVKPARITPVKQSLPTRKQPTPAERKLPTAGKPTLGVIEDLNTHFVKTDVPKRPLSDKPAAEKTARPQAKEAKQQVVKARVLGTASKKPAPTPTKLAEKPAKNSTYKPPKSPFINQNKVVKRPLSGNVYRKEIIDAVKEEPKGPVTIITKPEKDKHIGIIVTIIITIILGAAAGTIAFLLLPK